MSKNPAKDFGAIACDYVFFESHATQAEQDARAYVERLAGIVPAEGTIRLLPQSHSNSDLSNLQTGISGICRRD